MAFALFLLSDGHFLLNQANWLILVNPSNLAGVL